MAAASGFAKLIVGQGGLLSTPAVSNLVRKTGALGAILLTASHNPGGPNGDFGIKVNTANGGPASDEVMDEIYRRSLKISQFKICQAPDVDLESRGTHNLAGMCVEVTDPVADYAALMEQMFDFDSIRALLSDGGFRMRFDAMHAVTGPYAKGILQERLGATEGTVIRGTPSEDFGGCHPDPSLDNASELADELFGEGAPDFGAAADGDGDRNLILGKRFFVSPGDSLAILTENARLVPGYRHGLKGVARSMPTSRAVDAVADSLGIPHFETPTGWKYFGNLLDADLITICGEESFGTGSSHIREKDGLWAVLFWLNLLAVRKVSVAEIVQEHWARFGRHYFSRYDYSGLDGAAADDMMRQLERSLPSLKKPSFGAYQIESADEFSYQDPVDHNVVRHQGVRIMLKDDSRIVLRLSGTGSSGATLRIYFERFHTDPANHNLPVHSVVAPLVRVVSEVAQLAKFIGRSTPSAIV
jgi:phosphoglucomutase